MKSFLNNLLAICISSIAVSASSASSASSGVSTSLTCNSNGPTYGVNINDQPMFTNPPPLQIFSNSSWHGDFVLLRSQPSAGSDSLGAFSGTQCTYAFASSPTIPIIIIAALTYPTVFFSSTSSLVRFTYQFPNGVEQTSSSSNNNNNNNNLASTADDDAPPPGGVISTIALFPAFTAPIPANQPSNIITWSDSFMQASTSFTDSLGMAGGPVVYYAGEDVSASTLILSPLDQFLSSSLGNDMGTATASTITSSSSSSSAAASASPYCNASIPGAAGCWSAGVSSTFTSIPPGFQGSWIILSTESGITPLMASYHAMLMTYYAETAEKIPDISISGLSYTTDNGGQLTFGCPNQILDTCLLSEASYLKNISMPIQMLSFQNAPMVARGESAPWCVSEFVPNPKKVPMGIQSFQHELGLPLQLYAPYLCNTTDYVQNFSLIRSNTSLPGCNSFDFYTPVPEFSLEYFGFLMDLVLDYGGTLFEPDFLHQNHLCVNEFIEKIGAAEENFGAMATAAQDRGIAIQFCFATPHVILWTLTTPSITNARVSLDFYYGNSWNIGISSLMAWAANSAPSKDTLWSSDNGAQATTRGACSKTGCPADHSNNAAIMHTILAVLTTGPVGYSDAPNETDITLVMRTCDAVGNLLQPSRPIVAIDSTHDVTPGAAPSGFVLLTHTEIVSSSASSSSSSSTETNVWMYYLVSHHLTSPFSVRGLDMYPRLITTPPTTTTGQQQQMYGIASNWTALQLCNNGSAIAGCDIALVPAPAQVSDAFTQLTPQYDPFLPLMTLISPVCGSGTVLFGEVEKVTTISIQRFSTITCDSTTGQGTIQFSMVGQPGETVRIGYVVSGSTVMFLQWTFSAQSQGPSTVYCSVGGGAAAGCSTSQYQLQQQQMEMKSKEKNNTTHTFVSTPSRGSGAQVVRQSIARA